MEHSKLEERKKSVKVKKKKTSTKDTTATDEMEEEVGTSMHVEPQSLS